MLLEDLGVRPDPWDSGVPRPRKAISKAYTHQQSCGALHHENGQSGLHPAPHISITPENTDRTQVLSTSLLLDPPLEVA